MTDFFFIQQIKKICADFFIGNIRYRLIKICNELFSNNYPNIAGINISYENASVAAYEKALRQVSEELANIINNILKTNTYE